ncbi:MAG: NAD-dependent epimerase/dehydratase family protein [Bacteroidales bacterium]|nr:NAD-dependent epimerase/dehydratase family protein [Bacteroidales bacterium]
MENILILGASGQIGSELTLALRQIYGNQHVFATDIKQPHADIMESGPFELLDVMDDKRLIHFVIRHKITQIYHLAAVLSGNAEKLPLQAWHINMESLLNILEIARMVNEVKRIFWPSSIAVFGPTTPRINTPQLTVTQPTSAYGISKLAGERWCEYYASKYDIDIRSFRYPGLISYKIEPGGGTTDYAVEMLVHAVKKQSYQCFLREDTTLPMMFMDDAIRATIDIMQRDKNELTIHSAYNLTAVSFSPKELELEIKKHIPDFVVNYAPDYRQEIADSWPQSIDDSIARQNNGWKHQYELPEITKLMIEGIKQKLADE